jgi:hypothetical protein
MLCGISTPFEVLSPTLGQVTHALLTRPPLTSREASFSIRPFDLHVLSTPPAFVLSQDQTLHKIYKKFNFSSFMFLSVLNVWFKRKLLNFTLSSCKSLALLTGTRYFILRWSWMCVCLIHSFLFALFSFQGSFLTAALNERLLYVNINACLMSTVSFYHFVVIHLKSYLLFRFLNYFV